MFLPSIKSCSNNVADFFLTLTCLLSKKNKFGLMRLIKKKHDVKNVKEDIDFIDVSLQSESIINGSIPEAPINIAHFAEPEDDSDLKGSIFSDPAEVVRNHIGLSHLFLQSYPGKGIDDHGRGVRIVHYYNQNSICFRMKFEYHCLSNILVQNNAA